MADKYDEQAAKVWREVCTTPMVNETAISYTSIIAAALRNAVAEAVIEALLDITKGITKIMDQTMAAEYIKAKKQAKAEAYADAATIIEDLFFQALGQNEEAEKWLAAKIRARAQEVAG